MIKNNQDTISYRHCLFCNSIIPHEKRENKFCNSSCSTSYNNKKRSKSTINKVKNSLKNSTKINQILKVSENCKIYYCKACGKIHKSANDKNNCDCGLSTKYQSFKNLHKYFSLCIDNVGTKKFIEDFNVCRNKAIELYSKNSLPLLANILNHPDKTGGNIAKLLKNLNIEINSQSEAQKISILNSRRGIPFPEHSRYKTGHFTYKDKKYFYRSSYELKFANYLMDKSIDFDMESLRIEYYDSQKENNRVAIPDFVINDTIIEIKSNYTFDEINMIEKFKKYKELSYNPFLILEDSVFILDNTGRFIKANLPV